MVELSALVSSLEPHGRADCPWCGDSVLDSLANEILSHMVLGLPESPEQSDSVSLTLSLCFLDFSASLSLGYRGVLPWSVDEAITEHLRVKKAGIYFLTFLR